MNLLLDRLWYNRQQLTQLVKDLDKANPGAKWTRKVERMGIDENDNVTGDLWYKSEVYKLNGVPIFEVVTKALCEEWNDLRQENHETTKKVCSA